MYVPAAFVEDRVEVLHAMMREIGMAIVVSSGSEGPLATHVPVEIDPEPAPWGLIRCHFARPNPHVAVVEAGAKLLLVFQGPQGYVTPSWYPTKRQTGKVVPTWNYVAVHAYGTATTFEDPGLLRRHLTALTRRFEGDGPGAWSLDDAPPDFIDAMCRGIVGVELRVSRIEGKWKLSQNRCEQDRKGVLAGLRARGGEDDLAMAAWIERGG